MGGNSYQLLIKKLDEFIRKYYVNQIIRGVILFFSFSLFLFLTAVTAEYFGQFSSSIRTILFYGGSLILLAFFAFWIAKPLLKLIAIGKRISHEKAAQIIGIHFSKINDKLFNVLQLNSFNNQSESDLVKASIDQKINELHPFRFSLAINFNENKRYLKYFIIPAAIIIGLAAFEPKIIADSTNRLMDYSSNYHPKAAYSIQLENKNLNAFKNEDFHLEIKLSGNEIPSRINIIYSGNRYLMKKTSKDQFSYTFKNVQESILFTFLDEEFESRPYTLNLLPKPLLMDLSVQLKFPSYLGKEDKVINGAGDINVPEGTHARWVFNTENTDQLRLIGPDSSHSLIQSGENEFSYSQRIYESYSYGLSSANRFLKFTDTIQYAVSVIPDLSPFIEVEEKRDSLNPKALYFKGMVKDDYGFSKLLFHSKYIGSNDSIGLSESESLPINKLITQTLFYHAWNTDRFILKAGDQLEYYFEIWDNDGVNGAKSSRTRKMTFKAPTKQELKAKNQESNAEVKKDLKESIDLTKEIKKDLASLKEKLINKKKIGFQEKKQLESILKKQEKVKAALKQVEQENKQNNILQKEFDTQDSELLEKQQQLEEMFEKVMTEEMKEMMKEIEKMMEKLQKDELQKSLDKIELSNEDMMKEMERNLELFKQLELEKELSEAKKEIDELKEKQKELKEESKSDPKDKKGDSEELKEKQDELNKEFEELSKKLDNIQKKNKELESPNKFEETKPLEEEIKEDMQKSSEELSEKNKEKASESQESSEKKMDQLSDKINSMQMQSQTSAENIEDLRALLENLIQLSFDQEDVMQKLKRTNQNDPSYVKLTQEQKKLKDDSKIIEDSLFALSKRVIQLERTINKEMGKVNFNMEKAIEQLQERKTALGTSRQQHAMTSINNLALLLDEAIQQMQMQLMNGKGGGKCQKPGSGKPSSGSMKNLQKKLNQQMKALKDAMNGQKKGEGKGSNPDKSGKAGKDGLSKELAQMAAKQAAIRRAVKELQDQIGEGKNGKGGSLQELQELMEKTETDLVNKKITNETMLRQQEILTRLLESEKAEREREKEQKRESIEFTDEISRNQKIFLEYNRQKERELELLKTVPPSFSNFYKTKVNEYFNQLEK